MAGEGKRFKDAGYETPKPLILISGKPMIINAANSLPKADKWIFISRNDLIEDYKIDKILENEFDDVAFVIDPSPKGQASSCLLAKGLINNNEELTIGACDNGMIWDRDKFEKLKNEADCLVWTFRNNTTVKKKPEAYGWVVIDNNNNILKTSVKVPISANPINDHAIVGTFWFKKGSIFVKAVEDMIKNNDRIKNEFYVDQCINYVINSGHKAKVFEIEKYICWGTPEDLEKFQYWEKFFGKYDEKLDKKER
jgi:dTDP-glucose pyrophosphorylase